MSASLTSLAALLEPLRGFVAAGRRMSITLAADDLCLTQSAVSRQIRTLETRLGTKLLQRGHRSIAFTPEGAQLFRSANQALQQLQDALGAVRQAAARPPITLTASIGVTGLWLLPRLGRLQSLHPAIDLRVATHNRVLDLRQENIDLAIRYCSAQAAPAGASLLFEERIAPIAHPSLRLSTLDAAEQLDGQVLLEFDDPQRPWLQWPSWLAARGWRDIRPKATLRFNQYDQVVQSAMAGHGVALGRIPLLRTMLQAGQLALLGQATAPPDNDHGYWLVLADTAAPGSDLAAVVDWLRLEAGA